MSDVTSDVLEDVADVGETSAVCLPDDVPLFRSAYRVLRPYDHNNPKAAATKRFFERWLADERFRSVVLSGGSPVVAGPAGRDADADVAPDDVRILWDRGYQTDICKRPIEDLVATVPPAALHLLEWIDTNQKYRDRLRRESAPSHSAFAAWRERQMARAETMFRRAYDLNTPHIPFAIEISQGCSVGCWFCGVSAPRFDASFLHTPANADLFRTVLDALTAVTGRTAGGHGFLYWATDPFDNPDYERFCLDFKACCGIFPITTTAMALRDLERTRAFLDFAERHGAEKIRFSVSTLGQLDALHGAFSSFELRRVDILPFNKGSLLQPSAAGRARLRSRRATPDVEAVLTGHKRDETIACVSGFLVNMVRGTIKLISPCNSSDRWPLGYYVYDEARFAAGDDVSGILRAMIDRHMSATVPADRIVRFRQDLVYEPQPDGFRVRAEHGSYCFGGNPLMTDVADAIFEGNSTPGEVAADFASWYAADGDVALGWIDEFFRAGLLDEAPEPR